MGSLLDTARVVYYDDLQVRVGAAKLAPKEVAPNAAKAVDGNTELLGTCLYGTHGRHSSKIKNM